MTLSAPMPLTMDHELDSFSSGAPPLDDWLKRRARANQDSGATRTFVVAAERRVIAYYAIASGALDAGSAIGRFRRNMPNPIPVALLGRLAIDRAWQGQGLGRSLFFDCACRVRQAADILGIRGIVVHALSEQAKAFYIALGFIPSPLDPLMLMVTLDDIDSASTEKQLRS
jgi:GNAT superfamily N-acetyltransferase